MENQERGQVAEEEDGHLSTIKVGDYVNYTSPAGEVSIPGTQSGYTAYGGWQHFLTTGDDLTWRVLSIDDTTGQIKIVGSPTESTLRLKGKDGFANAEIILNSIASMYGGGYGAESVRSITVDDIYDAIGYNKLPNNYLKGYFTHESGEWFDEITEVDENVVGGDKTVVTGYGTTTTTATHENPVTVHNTIEGRPINTASQTIENGTAEEKAKMEIIYNMLFEKIVMSIATTTNEFDEVIEYEFPTHQDLFYWCASRNCYATSDGAEYGVYRVCYERVKNGRLWKYSKTLGAQAESQQEVSYGYMCVRPVVTLRTNINLVQDNNGVWNFVR